jgi:dolichyl-phosphate beta-glucosyltransferase
MNHSATLSVVVPAYNEARRLEQTIEKLCRYLLRSPFRAHEVVIVDDGSSDSTVAIAERLSEEYPSIRVIRQPENRGKGWATREGVLASRGDYILCTDADLATPIEDVHKLIEPLEEEELDVAIGSRKHPDSIITPQPLPRRILGRAGNILTRTVLGLQFRDTQCGFKLYRKSAARALFQKLSMPRFSFDFEILYRAKQLGLRVGEIGVEWHDKPFSTVRAKDAVQAFFDVFRVRFGLPETSRLLPSPELLRFMAVGVVNTGVDIGTYMVLTRGTATFATAIIAAKFFSFVAATISSFVLNRYWTFGIRTAIKLSEVVRFYATVTISMLANVSTMYVLTHWFGIYDLIAIVIATGITFMCNFTLSKLWVFKKPAAEAEVAA